MTKRRIALLFLFAVCVCGFPSFAFAVADLSLSKTVSNATPNVGDQITFTVTLTNNGPDPANGVGVTDLLPAGLTFVSATPSQGTYTPGTGLWNVGTVAPGTPQTLQIVATVVSSNPQTNTRPSPLRIRLIRLREQQRERYGDTSAGGPRAHQDREQRDTERRRPDHVHGHADEQRFGPCNERDGDRPGSCGSDIRVRDAVAGNLHSRDRTLERRDGRACTPQTLQIVATVVSSNPQTNTATITASDQIDPTPGNNSASATVTPPQADITLTIVASTPTPVTGTTLTWTVTATNNGPVPATNVTVTDLVPAGVTFVSATPSQGTYSSGTGLWSVGTLGSASLVLTVTAGATATVTDTASVSHSDQFDPNTANNSASSTVTIQVPLPPAVIPTLSDLLLAALALLLAALAVRGLRRRRR